MTDSDIIDRYFMRDESAVSASSEKYGSYCFTVADNILRDRQDSEECVNDTWLKAWDRIPPERPRRLRMFFAKITRNLALNRYKAKSADKRGGGAADVILDELAECIGGEDTEGEVIANELSREIDAFVRALPAREGSIFVRRYFFAEEIPVIAERYGVSAHNVTVILSRAREKLRRHLEKEGLI